MATSALNKLLTPRVVAHTGKKCTASVILLHGSGGSGEDVESAFHVLLGGELSFPHIRFVYPTAPVRPYALAGGMPSSVWFQRQALGLDVSEHTESVNTMATQLGQLIQSEVKGGVPLERIVLGGFSMGGCMALHLAYRYYPQVAGVLVLSSFLSKDSSVYKALEKRDSNSDSYLPPLLQCHGEMDDLVLFEWGQHTHARLTSLGVKGCFLAMPRLGHSINVEMACSVRDFITGALSDTGEL